MSSLFRPIRIVVVVVVVVVVAAAAAAASIVIVAVVYLGRGGRRCPSGPFPPKKRKQKTPMIKHKLFVIIELVLSNLHFPR